MMGPQTPVPPDGPRPKMTPSGPKPRLRFIPQLRERKGVNLLSRGTKRRVLTLSLLYPYILTGKMGEVIQIRTKTRCGSATLENGPKE